MPIRMEERPAADKWAIRVNDGIKQVLYEADGHDEALEFVLQATDGLQGWNSHGVDKHQCEERTITLYPPLPAPEPLEMPTGRETDGRRVCLATLGIREPYISDPLERQAEQERMERILEEEDELAIIRLVRRADQHRLAGNRDAA